MDDAKRAAKLLASQMEHQLCQSHKVLLPQPNFDLSQELAIKYFLRIVNKNLPDTAGPEFHREQTWDFMVCQTPPRHEG